MTQPLLFLPPASLLLLLLRTPLGRLAGCPLPLPRQGECPVSLHPPRLRQEEWRRRSGSQETCSECYSATHVFGNTVLYSRIFLFLKKIRVFVTCPLRPLPPLLLLRLPLLPSYCSKAPSPAFGPGGSRRWNLKKKPFPIYIFFIKPINSNLV